MNAKPSARGARKPSPKAPDETRSAPAQTNKKSDVPARPNCWEYYNCPMDRRQACSAFKKKEGRRCWQVVGTLCEGKTQGYFANKIGDCMKCEFYIQVHARRW